jgi:hypothetical protein
VRSAAFAEIVEQLLEEHPDEVRVVSRIFPLMSIYDKAALAAQAGEAAGEQDKFWEMHHLLYSQQERWVSLSVEDFEQWLSAQVAALGMDVDQFQADLKREDIVTKVQEAWELGQKKGIPGTPLILINGQIYGGPRDYNSFNDIVQLIAFGERQFKTCPAVTVQQDKQYTATLHTEKGDVVIQLFADRAPMTVNSFLFLARNGWYDNITFHRVILTSSHRPATRADGQRKSRLLHHYRDRPISHVRPTRHGGDGQLRARYKRKPVLYHVCPDHPIQRSIHNFRRSAERHGCAEETHAARCSAR